MGMPTSAGTGWAEIAELRYNQAVFDGDADAIGIGQAELDGVEADLALARGRLLHARFLEQREGGGDARQGELLERAVELYRSLGDGRGEGEAAFWLGTYHQVVREAYDEAVPFFELSYQLASAAGDKLTLSYATRHLGYAAEAAGRTDEARRRFEESVRLREEIGFQPGVAAAKLALSEFLSDSGDREGALAQREEARAVAQASGAHGVLRWIARAGEEAGT
jgi:tetratricopeptide (TPR) repeat protein